MDYTLISEIGNREHNEDDAKIAQLGEMYCFVLCDGLGGHGKGDVASQLVTNSMVQYFNEHPEVSPETIGNMFTFAQNALMQEIEKIHLKNSMKTTAVVLLTDNEKAIWAHIGDSRLYVYPKNKIVLRTLDHSVPQMLVSSGDIKEKEIRNHPDRNRLLRVMGVPWKRQEYEISEIRSLSECQAFLLCSDGFWEYITEKMMCKYLKKSHDSSEWLSLMLQEVQKNGTSVEMDNHTAIAVMLDKK